MSISIWAPVERIATSNSSNPVKYWRARFVLLPTTTTLLPAQSSTAATFTTFEIRSVTFLQLRACCVSSRWPTNSTGPSAHAISRRDLLLNLVYVAAVSDPVSVFFNVFVDSGKEFLPSMSPAKVIRNPVGDKKAELEGFKIPTSPASPPPIDVHAVDELIQQAANEMEHGSRRVVSLHFLQTGECRAAEGPEAADAVVES
jgi:hypothetical protein